jgi:hypothetical protein
MKLKGHNSVTSEKIEALESSDHEPLNVRNNAHRPFQDFALSPDVLTGRPTATTASQHELICDITSAIPEPLPMVVDVLDLLRLLCSTLYAIICSISR